MNKNWHFYVLIPIVFGMLSLFRANQQSVVEPNQEIVLQFSSVEVSSNQIHLAISKVKKQLETIGVSQVNIRKEGNGRLVLSYYSNITIAIVKDKFSLVSLAKDYGTSEDKHSELPTEQTYHLDVLEISKSSNSDLGSKGKIRFEFKQDYDRFSNPNAPVFASTINASIKNVDVLVAYKQNKSITTALNTIAYKIPKGRAGPIV